MITLAYISALATIVLLAIFAGQQASERPIVTKDYQDLDANFWSDLDASLTSVERIKVKRRSTGALVGYATVEGLRVIARIPRHIRNQDQLRHYLACTRRGGLLYTP